MKNPIGPCHICGDIDFKDLMMTCFNCRKVREHIYCARVCLRSVPYIWLCLECRSSTPVLQITNPVENNTNALANDNDVGSQANLPETTSIPEMSTKRGSRSDDSVPHGLLLLAQSCAVFGKGKVASLDSKCTSPSKKQRTPFLAFPSPTRKRRTLRFAG